ncbi:macrolide family glycosyltransferase [Pseudobacteroides cellulosolvens]|uniref:Glycosyltransferase, MGT family n=1 Tax=Pseudobacteroides cellulosolvens ATCC 35603 = DSM 2933 TaxID=398512 RepID=A0A0L6JSW5_9FIRM|nr:macrolide family glycosyltransferase [Pseudobacteroides cellulosolvens]KNY28908.1 glycosyltransferase, MGT family [Pseudobacteroides cellulosolvens ATCC 35603 = DSM 2933]
MSQVLFVNVFGYGHVNPTLGLVKELIERGEKVTYIAGEEFKEKIESLGAKFQGYKNFDESGFQNGNINFEDIEPQLIEIGRLYKGIIDIIFSLKEKFDYIIYDSLFFFGSEVGRVLGIPAISSNSTFATNNKTDYFSVFINGCMPVLSRLLNGSEIVDIIKYLWGKYELMLPDLSSLCTIKNDMNIVYTSKYFQMYGESFDESYKFIGPSIIDRKEKLDPSLQINNEKIIYISLGTIFNESIEFYQSCFKAFCNMDIKIIMSVGQNIDVDKFESVPSNFIIRNYVPQLEILKHADVFITHGGMNSVNEALYYSVPLILVPQFFDQPIVADRVAKLGAGIVIEKYKVTPELLKQSVVNILSDKSYKTNSEKIGKSLREAGGYKKGVDEIFKIISKSALSQRNEGWYVLSTQMGGIL